MISFVLPTFNRPAELRRTLEALGEVPVSRLGGVAPQIVVVDNASQRSATEAVPSRLPNGGHIEVLELEENHAAAGRNLGVEAAEGEWVVMLDDDSTPLGGDLAQVLSAMPDDVAAVGGEIVLPDGAREAGGLPEVVVGCGCVVRRRAYLDVGGYDRTLDYYAEEYDLCAKLIRAGHRVVHTRGLRFAHRKVVAGRAFDRILFLLVRNNLRLVRRYAPPALAEAARAQVLDYYRRIAEKESVLSAFERGVAAAEEAIETSPAQVLTMNQWQRWTGVAAVEASLLSTLVSEGVKQVSLVAPGKGVATIREVLVDAGIEVVEAGGEPIIGTLSPGPMLDAKDRFPDARPAWRLLGEP